MENHVQLIGHLGLDPEAKQINDTVKTTGFWGPRRRVPMDQVVIKH